MRKKGEKIKLNNEEVRLLESIIKTRTEKAIRIERERYILDYYSGLSIYGIAKKYKTNRPKVQRTIHKVKSFGVRVALDDLPRSGKKPLISKEARMWLLNIACQKPKDLGLTYEVWTMSELAKYVRMKGKEAGWNCFDKIGKGTIAKLLAKSNIKPYKVRYYQERRDKDFEEKMVQVLCVYKEVELLKKDKEKDLVVVCYDEKPGIQAIGNAVEDLSIDPLKGGTILRDSHYRRHGTISLLGAIDLFTGNIHVILRDRHRSEEFIEFLKYLDTIYPKDTKIKMVLDNHSAHISKKTRDYIKDKIGRFEFVFTPKHGSWLNLIEVFFSKMARTLLRWIRVESKDELKQRIVRYVDELNKEPVIFRWKYRLDEI
jgi:transposase